LRCRSRRIDFVYEIQIVRLTCVRTLCTRARGCQSPRFMPVGQGLRELDSSRCFRVEAQPRREGGTLRIWEHTFETLTGSKQPIPGPDLPIPAQPFDVDHVVPITTCPRFATAPVEAGGSMTHQALLAVNGFASAVMSMTRFIWNPICAGGGLPRNCCCDVPSTALCPCQRTSPTADIHSLGEHTDLRFRVR
jgi:hypothetical protein